MKNLKENIENICKKYTEFECVFDIDNWRKMVDELYDFIGDNYTRDTLIDDMKNKIRDRILEKLTKATVFDRDNHLTYNLNFKQVEKIINKNLVVNNEHKI